MKRISKYLLEALGDSEDQTVIQNLEVKWNGPNELLLQVPEAYSESDTQIYMDDIFLKDMPIEQSEEALGKNFKELTDEYFEYESMDMTQGTMQKADILWDDHYDQSMNGTNMVVVRIRGLKYCVTFNQFTVEKSMSDDEDMRDLLFNLFDGIGTENKTEIELVLNKENITWDE